MAQINLREAMVKEMVKVKKGKGKLTYTLPQINQVHKMTNYFFGGRFRPHLAVLRGPFGMLGIKLMLAKC